MALSLLQLIRRQRAALSAGNKRLIAQLARDYQVAYTAIQRDIDVLIEKIRRAREQGQEIGASWLMQQSRLRDLERQIQREIDRFGAKVFTQLTNAQRRSLELGLVDAQEAMRTAMGEGPAGVMLTFDALPVSAIENISSFLGEGSPVKALFDELGTEAAKNARAVLIAGLARGSGVQTMARGLRDALGISRARAETITRTEVLRAYREAARRTYEANGDLVKGWVWLSAMSARTCAMCFAMQGTFHKNDETLNDHPMGRCTMMPVTKTWAELGYPDVPDRTPVVESGDVSFGRLSAAQQQQVLGSRAAYEAYRDGRVTLKDFVGQHRSGTWGTMRYQLSYSKVQQRRRAA
jgi:SPP1 gp7 family putative phage head morphogenesis protein